MNYLLGLLMRIQRCSGFVDTLISQMGGFFSTFGAFHGDENHETCKIYYMNCLNGDDMF